MAPAQRCSCWLLPPSLLFFFSSAQRRCFCQVGDKNERVACVAEVITPCPPVQVMAQGEQPAADVDIRGSLFHGACRFCRMKAPRRRHLLVRVVTSRTNIIPARRAKTQALCTPLGRLPRRPQTRRRSSGERCHHLMFAEEPNNRK